MKKVIDFEHWNRKEHFEFFRKFDEPYWGLTVEVDFTEAYLSAKNLNHSFYSIYIYLLLKSVNSIENMRYRYDENSIYVYDTISVSPTVLRADGTFGFSYVDYSPNFHTFTNALQEEITRVQSTQGLNLGSYRDDVIHFSALPWINFSSLSHARSFTNIDACPKISVGRLIKKDNRQLMPVSIHVNHALVDGYHVGKFFEILDTSIKNFSTELI
jgi:chloramphenicol O-acetyltransferase type A